MSPVGFSQFYIPDSNQESTFLLARNSMILMQLKVYKSPYVTNAMNKKGKMFK